MYWVSDMSTKVSVLAGLMIPLEIRSSDRAAQTSGGGRCLIPDLLHSPLLLHVSPASSFFLPGKSQ